MDQPSVERPSLSLPLTHQCAHRQAEAWDAHWTQSQPEGDTGIDMYHHQPPEES